MRSLCALAFSLVSFVAHAQEVQLFNGKDLSNWTWVTKEAGSKIEDVWTVKPDGVLHTKGKPVGYIRTNDDYTSFKLTLEWRFAKPGNGGVLLRTQTPDKVWPKSIEAQLQHQNAGDIWNIDEFPMKTDPARTKGRRTEKLKPHNEKPVGEWNQYEITLDGANLKLVVNGEVQNEATDCQIVAGKICLQAEGAEMEFRNIKLTKIEKPASAEKSQSVPKTGSK